MTELHWSLDDIPWHAFDPAKVDGDLLKIIKAASIKSMVNALVFIFLAS